MIHHTVSVSVCVGVRAWRADCLLQCCHCAALQDVQCDNVVKQFMFASITSVVLSPQRSIGIPGVACRSRCSVNGWVVFVACLNGAVLDSGCKALNVCGALQAASLFDVIK